jgi:hypothetical protein
MSPVLDISLSLFIPSVGAGWQSEPLHLLSMFFSGRLQVLTSRSLFSASAAIPRVGGWQSWPLMSLFFTPVSPCAVSSICSFYLGGPRRTGQAPTLTCTGRRQPSLAAEGCSPQLIVLFVLEAHSFSRRCIRHWPLSGLLVSFWSRGLLD